MNIAILGAGIIGVTTAYELSADGHAVTVFERRSSVAEEASFAHAGMMGPGASVPWDDLRRGAMKWPGDKQPVSLSAHRLLMRRRQRELAIYSRTRFLEIADRMAYHFDRSEGHLMLLRDTKDVRMAQTGLNDLRELGVAFHEITAEEARQIEPALNPHTALRGAVYLPQDEVGNCRQFAIILRDAAQQLGARFVFNAAVSRVLAPTASGAGGPAVLLAGEAGERHFDAIVVCAGMGSVELLSAIGVQVPLQPVYGYSVSAAIPEPRHAPRSGVTDLARQVSITRHGKRVRVSGGLETGGAGQRINERAINSLYAVLADWFPAAGRLSNGVQIWKGVRPTTPDDHPLIGSSGAQGVWLNLGHGGSGWALACGSARVLADQMLGQAPAFDLPPPTWNR